MKGRRKSFGKGEIFLVIWKSVQITHIGVKTDFWSGTKSVLALLRFAPFYTFYDFFFVKKSRGKFGTLEVWN